jgi:hypothetical protein
MSVTAFQSLINPTLQKAYEPWGPVRRRDRGHRRVRPDDRHHDRRPLRDHPRPGGPGLRPHLLLLHDIHPNPDGYKIIADLVLQAYLASPQAG